MSLKKLFLSIIVCLFVASVALAQDPAPGSVTVFSESGENFTLYLNGDQKNATPATRVVAENISEVPVSFRIVFQNTALHEVKRNGLRQGKNCVYVIEKNKKGEQVLRMKGCSDDAPAGEMAVTVAPGMPVANATPSQLSATYADGVITINDGRTLAVKKIKTNGMTYPRVKMTALPGATVSLSYDKAEEKSTAESPFEYEVKDFINNNSYFTLTVDEGGPAKTWHIKLQNSNGYDLRIE